MESEPYEVQELHFREDEEKVAYVKRVQVDYFTDAVSAKGVWILQRLAGRQHPTYLAEQGEVLVAEKVVGFKKIKLGTLENVGSGEVELPQQEMQTTSAWLTVPPETLGPGEPLARGADRRAARGERICFITWRPSSCCATCAISARGWATPLRPCPTPTVTRESSRRRLLEAEQFNPTIYLYDAHAGGIGLAERLFEVLPELLAPGAGHACRRAPARLAARPASVP